MLGVYLTANPDDMEANFDEKIEEIEKERAEAAQELAKEESEVE